MKAYVRAPERPEGLPSDFSSLAVAVAIVAIVGVILTAIWGLEPPPSEPSPPMPSAPYYHAHGVEHR